MAPTAFFHHLLFCAALTGLSALVVRLMIRLAVLDQPEARKAHLAPTPKGGGVGVVAAFMVGVMILYHWAGFSRLADPYFLSVIAAAAAVAAVSWMDDLFDWPFSIKLAAQIGAGGLAIAGWLWVQIYRLPFIGPVNLGLWGAAATLAWCLLATNAMNFIDGLNGLAAGVTFIACLFLAFIAATHGGWFVYFASLLLAAGVAGFLPFNFPRARIFMGDVGSQFCGFMLAILGIAASRFQGVELSFLLPAMLLFGVLFDVIGTLLRRSLAGINPTKPHREHLYQLAHRSGLRGWMVTMVHWGFVLWGGGVSLLFLHAGSMGKLACLLLLWPPQLIWAAYVWLRWARCNSHMAAQSLPAMAHRAG